jgi:riboflavin synthase
MFTGIIKSTAKILSLAPVAGIQIATIERPKALDNIYDGASIACDGICLTVLKFSENSFSVQVMNETVQKTTASSWKSGYLLNLEPALKVGDPLDGHWVQGHIDTRSTLLEKKTIRDTIYLRFALDSKDQALVVPQGSIAINGVSLTLSAVSSSSITVALITHTLQNSNLSSLTNGSYVNIEFDILGKYILRSMNGNKTSPEDLSG